MRQKQPLDKRKVSSVSEGGLQLSGSGGFVNADREMVAVHGRIVKEKA